MRVLIDANVLYPTVMREVVLGCAEAGLFEARWSERIEEEVIRAAARRGAEMELQARGEMAALTLRFPDAKVRDYEGLERRLWLPDPADIHVIAAAVKASADVILTQNRADFPRSILAEEGLERAEADGFLTDLWRRDPDKVGQVVARVVDQARVLSGEDWTERALLKKARLPRLGKAFA